MSLLNTPRSTWIALVIAVGLLGATWYPGLEERFRQHKPMNAIAAVGQPVNLKFTLKDLDGKDVSLASFAGKPLIVNFYATWCGPCRVETPDLVELAQAHPEIGVVGILWMDEDGDARAFQQQYKVTYPLLNGNRPDDVDDAFGPIDGLPRSVVIDAKGTIVAIHEGATLRPTFERDLAKLR